MQRPSQPRQVFVLRVPFGPIDILSFGRQQSFDDAGMRFVAAGTPPASTPGQFMWVQLIRGMQMKVRGQFNHDCESGAGLDNSYPYVDPYGELPKQTSDSPAVLLTRPETSVERDFGARMHLMWDPALPSGCSVARPGGRATARRSLFRSGTSIGASTQVPRETRESSRG